MLRYLDVKALDNLARAGYGAAVLALPMLDERSPSPETRAKAAGVSFVAYVSRASSFQGATMEYMSHYVQFPAIRILDAPYSEVLLSRMDPRGLVTLSVDHAAWAGELKFACQNLSFENCSLDRFARLLRAQPGHVALRVYLQSLAAGLLGSPNIWSYSSNAVLEEAQDMGPGAFAGLLCIVGRTDVDPVWVANWQALGFVAQL